MGARTASIVVTDLVGSTALRTELGEDAADALRREHDAMLAAAVGEHGGVVVKGLGDGVLAMFDGAAAAMGAAVAVQQAFESYRRRRPDRPLHVRVGISAGDVSVEDDDCFGTPVVEAARLCAAADGDQVLAAALVEALARGRGEHVCVPRGALALKGLPGALDVVEVTWAPPDDAVSWPPPLPRAVDGLDALPLRGRDAVVATLRDAWKRAGTGVQTTVLIEGEAGIGKSRVAAEIAAIAHHDGAVVLAGRCEDDAPPFQPIADALRALLATAPVKLALVPRLGSLASELTRLVPELEALLPRAATRADADPENARHALFAAVYDWLRTCASDDGVVLVVEDLHWADRATVQLLRRLARQDEPVRMLLVATYRGTDVEADRPLASLLGELRRAPDVVAITLRGLDRGAVAAMVADAATDGAADHSSLWEQTHGHPLFVLELLRQADIGDGATRRLPAGVRDAIHQRLDRLDRATKEVLSAAAIVGSEFTLTLVSRVARRDADSALDSLDVAVAAGILEETAPERYRFAHALFRETLYDEVSLTRRARNHRTIAETLEQQPGVDLVLVATHWLAAGADEHVVARAVPAAIAAGDDALRRLAFERAEGMFRRALALAERGVPVADAVRARLLFGLARARGINGHEFAEPLRQASELARRLPDPQLLVDCALFTPREAASALNVVDDDRIARIRAALEAVEPDDSSRRARLLAANAFELALADPEQARRLSDDAIATARAAGDPLTLFRVLFECFVVRHVPENAAERLGVVAELSDIAAKLDDDLLRCQALALEWWVAVEHADGPRARRATAARLAATERLALPTPRWSAVMDSYWVALADGDFDAAERIAEAGLELGMVADAGDAPLFYGASMLMVRRCQGRFAECVGDLETAIATVPALAFATYGGSLAIALAFAGRDADARALLHGVDFDTIPRNVSWVTVLTNWVSAARLVDDATRATELYERLTSARGLVACNGATLGGAVDHYLAILSDLVGDHEHADDEFATALRLNEALEHRYYCALTRCLWGCSLARRNDRRASPLLERALVEGEAMHAVDIARDARRALEQLR